MMLKYAFIAVIVTLLLATIGLGNAAPAQVVDCIRKYRLPEASESRELVHKAISLANHVLGPEVRFRFRPSWVHDAPRDVDVIPVALSYFDPPGKYGICFVPKGDRCVLIDAVILPQLMSFFSQGFKDAIPIALEDLLALALLHEAGHVYHGHAGAFDLSSSQKATLNVEDTKMKQDETQADAFAAQQIKAGSTPPQKDVERFTTSVKLGLALGNIGFNLTGSRVIDHFGASVLNLPSVFQDVGYSHPNLYLRILQMNHVLTPSPITEQLLNDFLQGKKRSTNPAPLYQSSPSP
jgi:hypothetical protein